MRPNLSVESPPKRTKAGEAEMRQDPDTDTSIRGVYGGVDDKSNGNPMPRADDYQARPVGSQQPVGSQGYPGPIPAGPVPNTPGGGFDEYGAEMAPDARVWKTYVAEADKFDADQVDGWNKSLDVLLIFAALFSAICTAFLIESSKTLKEDPAEKSAEILESISRTLLIIAKNQAASLFNETTAANSRSPPRSLDICVNALWFFSLILSIAVSLMAMLAKEWCYRFMSGRTGDPWSQVKRRQQRWNEIDHWKMKELVVFLPSLIQLAFLSFAIGLCIYLGDMHFGVALPVIFVTAIAIFVYAASTILPLKYEWCPYSTTITRLIEKTPFGLLPKSDEDFDSSNPRSDPVAFDALCWLLKTCENPQSVDIALQAIAGADNAANRSQSREPLIKCGAVEMIYSWMTSGSIDTENPELFERYARALSFLHSQPITNSIEDPKQLNHEAELRRKIRSLQKRIVKTPGNVIASDSNYLPSEENESALRTGSMAACYCLQALSYGSQTYEWAERSVKFAIDLEKWKYLHREARHTLIVGTTMLFSCSIIHCDPPTASRLVSQILSKRAELPDEYLGLLMLVFGLSRSDYPGWTHPPPLSSVARAERAIEAIMYYDPGTYTSNIGVARAMTYFGLLELLSKSQTYNLIDEDFGPINDAFVSLQDVDVHHVIHTLPPTSNICQHTVDIVTRNLLAKDEQHDLFANGTLSAATAHLTALHRIYRTDIATPTDQVYVFVIEFFCKSPPDTFLDTMALDLMYDFPRPKRSESLVRTLNRRNIPSLLVNTLRSEHFEKKLFATRLLYLLINLASLTSEVPSAAWGEFSTTLLGGEDSSDSPILTHLEQRGSALATEYGVMLRNDTKPRHKYFATPPEVAFPVQSEQL